MDIVTMFLEEQMVSLDEILLNREKRVDFIEKLLEKFPSYTVISLKCNIPGSVKNNTAISLLFQNNADRLEQVAANLNWNILYKKRLDLKTGSEEFLVVDEKHTRVKEHMIEFEEKGLGRLFDADVYYLCDGNVSSVNRQGLGYPSRKCFICDQPVQNCSGRRTHTISELQAKIVDMINTNEESRQLYGKKS